MYQIKNYLTFAHHEYLFNMGYQILQQNPDDLEVLAVTFEQGVLALSALEEMNKTEKDLSKNKDLAQNVYELSQQRRRVVRNIFYPFESKIPEF